MKVALLGSLVALSALVLTGAFPSPKEHRGRGDGKTELPKKTVVKREDEEWEFDISDIGRYSMLSRLDLSGMDETSKEENDTLWGCYDCCGTNTSQKLASTDDKKEGTQDARPSEKMNMMADVNVNITDHLGGEYNSTLARCLGCCGNVTTNGTDETQEMRKQRETELPPIHAIRLT